MKTIAIESNPLLVPPHLAAELKSVDAAIVVQQIHYWMEKECGEIIDGARWIYNTLNQWLDQFPWMTQYQLRKAMDLLRAKGIIKFAQHTKHQWQRKGWYTIDYERLKPLLDSTCDMNASQEVEPEPINVSSDRTSNTETTPKTTSEKEREENCYQNGAIASEYEAFLRRLILRFKNPVIAVEAWLEKNAPKKSFQREFLKTKRPIAQRINIPPPNLTQKKLEPIDSFEAALGRNKAKWVNFPGKRHEVENWVKQHRDRVKLGLLGPEPISH